VTVLDEETVVWPTISLPCESQVEDCDRAAVWAGRTSCCKFTFLLCNEHREDYLKRMEFFSLQGFRHRCGKCGMFDMKVTWSPI
jgi:hypothetical protein